MKFYPSDWRADPALRSCTIAARGLWVEMLCIMHEAEPYGSLLIKSQRLDKKRLALLCGISEKECIVLLLELEGFGVFERDQDGTIYSRRMRRDHAKAEEGRKQVAKRWNGEKPGRLPNRSPKPETGCEAITPEARSQIPEAEKKETREVALSDDWPSDFENRFWVNFPNKVGKPAAMKALSAARRRKASFAEILSGLDFYIRSKPPDRSWLNPATFLNQNRWEDRPATVSATNGPNREISSACDRLISVLDAGFGGTPSQERSSGGADEIDARLLSFGRG